MFVVFLCFCGFANAFPGFRFDFLGTKEENPDPGQILRVSYSTIRVYVCSVVCSARPLCRLLCPLALSFALRQMHRCRYSKRHVVFAYLVNSDVYLFARLFGCSVVSFFALLCCVSFAVQVFALLSYVWLHYVRLSLAFFGWRLSRLALFLLRFASRWFAMLCHTIL